jgi:hypothetical protein
VTKVWHIVLFHTADDVTPERVEEIRGLFRDCVGPCDGLEWVEAASNDSKSQFAEGWREAVVMQFRDRAARDAYIDHPLHKRAGGEAARGYYTDLTVFDMEVASDG